MRKEKGQTVIEAVVVLKLIFTLITLALVSLYLIYTNHIVDFFSQKSLICMETLNKKESFCKNELKLKLEHLLFFHSSIKVYTKRTKYKNTTRVKASFIKKNFKWENKLKKIRQ